MKARYEGRPFLLERDMGRAKVSTPEQLRDYYTSRMTRDLSELTGQEVSYRGEKGTVQQDEGGKFTIETEREFMKFPGKFLLQILLSLK